MMRSGLAGQAGAWAWAAKGATAGARARARMRVIGTFPGCCRGKVCTPRGPVSVAWRHENGKFTLEIAAPADTPVRVVFPDGSEREFDGGRWSESVALR